jgi:hypothetical protein
LHCAYDCFHANPRLAFTTTYTKLYTKNRPAAVTVGPANTVTTVLWKSHNARNQFYSDSGLWQAQPALRKTPAYPSPRRLLVQKDPWQDSLLWQMGRSRWRSLGVSSCRDRPARRWTRGDVTGEDSLRGQPSPRNGSSSTVLKRNAGQPPGFPNPNGPTYLPDALRSQIRIVVSILAEAQFGAVLGLERRRAFRHDLWVRRPILCERVQAGRQHADHQQPNLCHLRFHQPHCRDSRFDQGHVLAESVLVRRQR